MCECVYVQTRIALLMINEPLFERGEAEKSFIISQTNSTNTHTHGFTGEINVMHMYVNAYRKTKRALS